jgi:hypothetical protein
VEQGQSGRCWPGWGGPSTAGAGRGRAWPGRRQLGRSGSGVVEAGPGLGVARVAPAREAGVGHHRRGDGCSGSTRSSWWRQRCASLYNAWKRYEREKRVKERTRPGILAYVRRADTSTDEHKRAGLYGGRDALCLSATRRT